MYFVISCSVIVLIIFGSQYFIYPAPNINYHVPGKYLLYEEIVSGLYKDFFLTYLIDFVFLVPYVVGATGARVFRTETLVQVFTR